MRLVSHTSILARRHRFPWLIKGFKEEHINTPIHNPTNRSIPERLRAAHPRNGSLVRTPRRRPSTLTNPQLRRRIRTPSHGLDMAERLHNIIEERCRRVADRLALPITECVAEEDVDAAFDESVGGAVHVFIPGISGADFEGTTEGGLRVLDLGEELRTGEVSAVEGLGSYGYGVDLGGIERGVLYDCGFVCGVGFICVGPVY
jgi:hypothetical protein